MDGDLAQTVMVPGLLVIAVVAGWGAWRLMRAGRPVTTLLLMVLAVSIAAPVAVTHHWTGIIVAVVLLASLLLEGRPMLRDWPTLVGVVLLLAANLLFDNNIGGRTPMYVTFKDTWLLGNLPGLAGILCFILLLVAAWRAVPRRDLSVDRAS